MKVVLAEDSTKVENNPDSGDYIDEAMMGRLKKEGNKVSFDEMGKIIGQRWKNIDPDRLAKYSELASEDAERYKKEMKSYNSKQEAKMRSEAVKPPQSAYAATPTSSSSRARSEMGGTPAGPGSMDPRQQGYPPEMGMQSAFGSPMAGGYGYPMDYGYGGMGMGAPMYGYGGYPSMGGSPEQMGYPPENPYARGMYQQPGSPMSMMPPGQYQQMGYP